ncbi:MAG: sigma-70 family RNA polymerase sigma factor [Verrucomicrobia bacterium]|nr:sigma-70 family RNA polymerase sigma factor [Verrucomicrobiota bacterium]
MDDLQLIERARNGEEDAFGELVKKYHQRVYAVIYGFVQNPADANDLTQQSWVKAWQKLDSFRGGSQFFTWLYRIAVFTAMDHARKRKRQKETVIEEGRSVTTDPTHDVPPSVRSNPAKNVQNAEIKERFSEALNTLSEEHRMALVLREVEGLSYDEIAKVMKCRKGTVMSRIHYARKSIQDQMRDLL